MSSVRKLQNSKKFTNMFAVLDDSDDENNSHTAATATATTKASKKKNRVPSVVAVKVKETPTKGISYAQMAVNNMPSQTSIPFRKPIVDPYPPRPRVLDLSNKRSWTDMMNDTDSDDECEDYSCDSYENIWKI